MTAFALGTAVATVVAGVLAHYANWRLVFALPGLLAVYLVVALRRLPEPPARRQVHCSPRSAWSCVHGGSGT
ncbi:MFS family permease [Streptomyces sp. B1I3]|nr:MFS family permease [Streptomyces sp. B1I3]